jgi:hypothetical protein
LTDEVGHSREPDDFQRRSDFSPVRQSLP